MLFGVQSHIAWAWKSKYKDKHSFNNQVPFRAINLKAWNNSGVKDTSVGAILKGDSVGSVDINPIPFLVRWLIWKQYW